MILLRWCCILFVFLVCCELNEQQDKNNLLNATVEVGFGESVSLNRDEMNVTFLDVMSDSRCPIDVTCIHAGEATILVQVLKKDGTHGKFELDVLTQNTANVDFEEYGLHLEKLMPWSVSTKTIELEEYIAVFKIKKTADN
ncbi:hypothetical protein SAMN05443144_10833 [Fodinibius roseus]|uniref:Uncharacterized protein n=1 Tax=Fodinibius roseus TaxID=1194090 RepID=A0A1M5B8L1_9BACT|nr:hypothetical protein [Fodinibius roseus]SHF38864.1 hypothetical protein SAMN05443144_10833 [Fodinibius roseus]